MGRDDGIPAGKATVLPAIFRPPPFDITDMTVPKIVAALAPGLSVATLGITTFPSEAVWIGWPATVARGIVAVGCRGIVLSPMTTEDAKGPRLNGVPLTVMAGPPGASVWPATTN